MAQPGLQVVIETPRGSRIRRGSHGRLAFVSPWACPFNYGFTPDAMGGDGDPTDVVLLGPKRDPGAAGEVPCWAVLRFQDAGLDDDKLICGAHRPDDTELAQVLAFFRFYARFKRWRDRLLLRGGGLSLVLGLDRL